MPRFADPWAFRPRLSWERATNLHGTQVNVRVFRQGGVGRQVADFDDPLEPQPPQKPERQVLNRLRRRLSKQIAVYRLSRLFTEAEMRVIETLLHGLSLRECARREGVTAQAIEDRIQRLKNRAPFFWNFWRQKNLMRSRR